MLYKFYQWQIQGAPWTPPGSISFIFMQFSVKNLPIGWRTPSLQGWYLPRKILDPPLFTFQTTFYVCGHKNVISHFYGYHGTEFNVPTELHRITIFSFPFWLMLFSNFLHEEIFQFSLLFTLSMLFIHDVKLFYYTFFACLHHQYTCIIPWPGVQRVNIHNSERIKHLISEINSQPLSQWNYQYEETGRQTAPLTKWKSILYCIFH